MRFLLYSHDSFGLGHLRRSVTIGGRLLEQYPGSSVLITTGSPVATGLHLPKGIDVLKLPSVTKDRHGSYTPREWDLTLDHLLALRSGLLVSAVECFRPHVFLVDHKPIGLLGELQAALRVARSLGTRCVLGLRDIIDHPDAMEEEWGNDATREALANGYDKVMIYGDRGVFDASVEYPQLAQVGDRITFTGYVVRPKGSPPFRPLALLHPHVVVTVGGGEDGSARVHAYLDAVEQCPTPWRTTLILGPLFGGDSGREVKQRAMSLRSVVVHRSHNNLPVLLRDASAVVSMAGYNTCSEIMQARIPSVLLPRTTPRREQLVRAQCLARRGLASCVVDVGPEELHGEITRAVAHGPVRATLPNLQGAEKAAALLIRYGLQSGLPITRSSSVSHSAAELVS